jgi:hypothetical protein
MIFRIGLRRTPVAPAVVRKKYSAACSDDDRVLFVFVRKRMRSSGRAEATDAASESPVLSSKDRVVVADANPGELIFLRSELR